MAEPVFTTETFRFFRELARNNRKAWMDANRDRYRAGVVEPFHVLLDRLTPCVRKLDRGFEVGGRTGENFSRINRDIRFAADKTPYRAQMYLKFSTAGANEAGQLYVGVAADAITAGFRIYYESRECRLAQMGIPRAMQNPEWIEKRARRLDEKYESYWYASAKGDWTKHGGWPRQPEEWKQVKGWIVRRKMKPAAAMRAGFIAEVEKIFREMYPLYQFTSKSDWKPRA